MSTSLLARMPNIPHPPYHGVLASISSVALLSLFCANKVPRHPLVVVTWAYGSYYLNAAWLKLKLAQVQATIVSAVDIYLKKEGACEDCRKDIHKRDPEELIKLLTDLSRAKARARISAGRGASRLGEKDAVEDGQVQMTETIEG